MDSSGKTYIDRTTSFSMQIRSGRPPTTADYQRLTVPYTSVAAKVLFFTQLITAAFSAPKQAPGSELVALTHDSSNKISAAAILDLDDLRDRTG
ncbi:hypothetical protein PENNAL_c0137G06486, partial [Penicillium nalgiovense]